MNPSTSELLDLFCQKFGEGEVVVEAPGRINLIGEHTDYNDGFVLPAAINKAASFVISKSGTSQCEIIAYDLNKSYQFRLDDDLVPVEEQWVNYFLGVIDGLKAEGARLKGFNLMFSSNIPIGAGLSSSAALEVGFGFSLIELFSLGIAKRKLALIGQQAEHRFAGVMCGIMDQFASALSREGYVFKLDCRSLAYDFIPADLGEYKIVLFDTQIEHDLASTEYNIRREQCAEGVKLIQHFRPQVKSLRDVALFDIDSAKEKMPTKVYDRCKYIVEENARVLEASEALKIADVAKLGELMYQSHKGLSELYEVSCKELDLLVELSKDDTSILGARMMGGGFGGCTINLIKAGEAKRSIEEIKRKYLANTSNELKVYQVELAEGVRRLTN